MKRTVTKAVLCLLATFALALVSGSFHPVSAQSDPGVRGGAPGAGDPLPGLTAQQSKFFAAGLAQFLEVQSVQGEDLIPDTEPGLGPTFNMNTCSGCHAQPTTGGSSPAVNPQVAVANAAGATNVIPPFVTSDGPVREARFKFNPDGSRDGGVHVLFTIKGRSDAGGCTLAQPNFAAQVAANNVSLRVPTPVFGAGLIENIPDSVILDNRAANGSQKAKLGISGHENREGNTGTITRFGWKAQNKSLVIFSGEAYLVEQGVTNELFPQERDGAAVAAANCLFNPLPEDITHTGQVDVRDVPSNIDLFALFQRFLAPPARGPVTPSVVNGEALFTSTGCALCHTPTLTTGISAVEALDKKTANLFSDLLVHHMGTTLADDIIQGNAGPDEFRTSPLWGLGQRIFFLHDGRTKDLVAAIQAHSSSGSEANGVITNFNRLSKSDKQAILDFLRSL